MAAESTYVGVTPEIAKPKGGVSRRNSMGKGSSSNSGEKILPHYLRASTGSCHDFCKYGRKHALEEAKERRSIPKRTTTSLGGKSPVQSMTLPQRKNTPVVKPKPSPILKKNFSDVPEIIKREVCTESPDGKKKTSALKLRTSLDSKTRLSESPKFKRQGMSLSSEKLEVSSKQASPKAKEANISAKPVTLKPKSLLQKSLSSLGTSEGLGGRRNSDTEMGKGVGASKVTVKKVMTSPRASLSPKPSMSRVASLNARKTKSLRGVSPLKNQRNITKAEPEQPKDELKQADDDLAQEKTLYVIKMKTENESLESDRNESCVVESSPLPKSLPTTPLSSSSHNEVDQETSEYTETEAEDGYLSESGYDETLSVEEEENGNQRRPRKDGMVHSDDKDSEAVKLRFRRGKVVDIQSENNNSPRRLKFRRGRVLGENQILKAEGRRSFKKRGTDGETNDGKPDSEKVVLRHQDVQQGKRDSQVLFNNVIEQTASKLAETRKSKVKALVGAFETVISLQESKPSANA